MEVMQITSADDIPNKMDTQNTTIQSMLINWQPKSVTQVSSISFHIEHIQHPARHVEQL